MKLQNFDEFKLNEGLSLHKRKRQIIDDILIYLNVELLNHVNYNPKAEKKTLYYIIDKNPKSEQNEGELIIHKILYDKTILYPPQYYTDYSFNITKNLEIEIYDVGYEHGFNISNAKPKFVYKDIKEFKKDRNFLKLLEASWKKGGDKVFDSLEILDDLLKEVKSKKIKEFTLVPDEDMIEDIEKGRSEELIIGTIIPVADTSLINNDYSIEIHITPLKLYLTYSMAPRNNPKKITEKEFKFTSPDEIIPKILNLIKNIK